MTIDQTTNSSEELLNFSNELMRMYSILTLIFIFIADTSYEKACRRGSAPSTPILGQKNASEHQTTSRFTNFFSKRYVKFSHFH